MAIKNPDNHKAAITALRQWRDAKENAKAAVSAEGKAHTKAKNAISLFLREEDLPASTGVLSDGGVYTYTVATTERVKPREWYRLWQEGEITEEQFFAALSVAKDEAKNAIGADQVETISESRPGKDAKVKFAEGIPAKGAQVVAAVANPRLNKIRPNVKPALQPSANKPGLRQLTLKRKP